MPVSIGSAQRLSASLEFTPPILKSDDACHLVLNAFRHHWNSHNAQLIPVAVTGECSTPFGIIGIHTIDWLVVVTEPDVLNAFRHHWNSHFVDRVDKPPRLQVLNAFRHHWNSHTALGYIVERPLLCAQRLSASLEFTLR